MDTNKKLVWQKIIEPKKTEYTNLFENNLVSEAFLFGSVTTDNFNKDSDIDFIINFKEIDDPLQEGENWWNIFYGLKTIFNRNIDIVNEKNLTNPYFINEINNTKVKIYG